MEVRRLRPEERFDADLVSHIAFHMCMEDAEEAKRKSLKEDVDDWGALDGDGRVMARIIHHRFDCFLDGHAVPCGGIGAVSTLPEYRGEGAVRAIFSALLSDAMREGEVLSSLYPFNHAFYRKFGYETVCPGSVYRLPPEVLREYRFTGRAEQWKPGDGIGEYLDVYLRFAKGYNMAVKRTEERLRRAHFEGAYFRDRKFAYLLREGGEALAYVIFRFVREDTAILRVEDLAFLGRRGFLAILGFLGRFSADYGRIELPLPGGMELYSLIHAPDEYAIAKETRHSFMVRAVNAQRVLEGLRCPPGCAFAVRVADDLIGENNGVFLVEDGRARRTDGPADLSVDIRALGMMAVGAVSLAEAEMREDTLVLSGREKLERIFVRKPVFIRDEF